MSGEALPPIEPGQMHVRIDGKIAVRRIAYRETRDSFLSASPEPPRDVPETSNGERVEWVVCDHIPLIIKS